ncbi:MAG: hypothetical protein ACI4JR_02800, partial [Acutalibacteraceae bacterium]
DEKMKISVDLLAGVKKKKKLRHDTLLELYRAATGADNVTDSLNRDALAKFAVRAKRDANGLPLFYTEWNMCASFSAPCNDTRMQAAYDVHSILETQNTIDGSSIWCFTDLFEELHPFPEEFHGGFGLMTQSGIRKPTYYALQMLNDAGAERYVIRENNTDVDVAAFRSEHGIQVLLSKLNFRPTQEKTQIQVCIESDRRPECVVIRRIDESHGNPLKIWESMGAPKVPTPTEVQKISDESAVTAEDLEYIYEDSKVSFSVQIGDNDVCFIEVI